MREHLVRPRLFLKPKTFPYFFTVSPENEGLGRELVLSVSDVMKIKCQGQFEDCSHAFNGASVVINQPG